MSSTLASHTIEVPGGRLRYQTGGTGPLLALIGLPMAGAWFGPLASRFARDHTVVTYDPRGFAGSAIDDPGEDSTPVSTARDVCRLLDALTSEPVAVFGSSGGAVTGLELVARYPERVRVLVAHEPPLVEMLPDARQVRARVRDIYDTYLAEGTGPAFATFLSLVFDLPEPELGAPPAAPPAGPQSERDEADTRRMFGHSLLPTTGYRPDITALRTASSRVVIAAGRESGGQLCRRASQALADALGAPLTEFPGDHGGFLDPDMGFPDGDPEAFARVLREVLAGG